MTEKYEIFTSGNSEVIYKSEEIIDKIFSSTQTEEPQQVIETIDETSSLIEGTTEQTNEETVKNPEINEIATNVAEILSLVKVSNYKDETIDNLHKELQQHKRGLQETIIAPLLKTIVREYGWVRKQYCFYLEKSQEEPQSELFGRLLSEFDMLSFSLLKLLNDYYIEPFHIKEGDEKDFNLQNIVEIVETEDPQQDGTVAECITCGFHNIKNNRLFSQAEVKIYKFKNNQ